MLTGSEIILKKLIENKIDTIFGYPGGAIMPVYDSLLDYKEYITHYRTAHEQGAVHAADGYARSTGKVGICFATSGPGATNTVTGIATAYLDSVPLVVFTGQVPLSLLGKDSFQEIDITSICEPITKKTFLVEDVNDIANTIDQAIAIAQGNRPGPVLVDLPKDILLAKTDYSPSMPTIQQSDEIVNKEKIEQIAMIIDASDRPLIYAGGGVKIAKASHYLVELAEEASIPVANTLMGLGNFPIGHPLSLGLSGMHGHPEVNEAISNCDLLLVIGARFSDRSIGKSSEFANKSYIIHLDIDDTEFSKNIPCHLHLKGNLDQLLKNLNDKVKKGNHSEWLQWIETKKHTPKPVDLYCPENIIKTVNNYYTDDTILVTDTGQHQMWSAQHWKFNQPNGLLTSGGLGTMGYGLGAAIGASVGNPDQSIVLITGDGSFRMNCNELLTVSSYDLPLTIILINNQSLGMVRQWQKMFNNKRYSETDTSSKLDYIKLCAAYDIPAEKVDTLETLNKALIRRKSHKGSYFIEVVISKDEDVYPFVPPGKSIADYLIESK